MSNSPTNHRPLVMLRLPDVLAGVALGKSAVYNLIKEGGFPRPAKLGTTSVWPEHEIDQWL